MTAERALTTAMAAAERAVVRRPGRAGGRDFLAEYVAYRDALDMPNAIAVWGEMADHVFERASANPTWDPSRRSIVSAFMPKSGGTFIHNRLLAACGFVDYYWAITHPLRARLVYAVPRALEHYLAGGMACHTHFLPGAHNMSILDAAGVDRVWVHVRDPREAVVSNYYHSLGIGHGSGEIAEERARQAREQAARLGLDLELGNAAKLNAFVREQIESMTTWLEQWLALSRERPGYVVVSTFPELRHPEWMLARVFDEFGMSLSWPEMPDAMPADRRRRDREQDWRHDLTPETVAFVDDVVRASIGRFALTSVICPGL
jgi:hypothetical protein